MSDLEKHSSPGNNFPDLNSGIQRQQSIPESVGTEFREGRFGVTQEAMIALCTASEFPDDISRELIDDGAKIPEVLVEYLGRKLNTLPNATAFYASEALAELKMFVLEMIVNATSLFPEDKPEVLSALNQIFQRGNIVVSDWIEESTTGLVGLFAHEEHHLLYASLGTKEIATLEMGYNYVIEALIARKCDVEEQGIKVTNSLEMLHLVEGLKHTTATAEEFWVTLCEGKFTPRLIDTSELPEDIVRVNVPALLMATIEATIDTNKPIFKKALLLAKKQSKLASIEAYQDLKAWNLMSR